MKESTKIKMIIGGFLLWVACAVIWAVFRIEWLGTICVMAVAAVMAIGDAQGDKDRREQARQSVFDNGTDWAIKELVANPDMNSSKADGLRKGIQDYEAS